jgi:hypothetical protein
MWRCDPGGLESGVEAIVDDFVLWADISFASTG